MFELELRQQFNKDFQAMLLAMLWDEVIFQLRCRVDEENKRSYFHSGDTRFSQELGRCSQLKKSDKDVGKLLELSQRLSGFDPDSGRYGDLNESISTLLINSKLHPDFLPLNDKLSLVTDVANATLSFAPLVARREMLVSVAKEKEKAFELGEQQVAPRGRPAGLFSTKTLPSETPRPVVSVDQNSVSENDSLLSHKSVKKGLSLKEVIENELASLYDYNKKNQVSLLDIITAQSKPKTIVGYIKSYIFGVPELNAAKNLLYASSKTSLKNNHLKQMERDVQVLSQLKKFKMLDVQKQPLVRIRQEIFNRLEVGLNAFNETDKQYQALVKTRLDAKNKAEAEEKLQAALKAEADNKMQNESKDQAKLDAPKNFQRKGHQFLNSAKLIYLKGDANEWREISQNCFDDYENAPEDVLLLYALLSWFLQSKFKDHLNYTTNGWGALSGQLRTLLQPWAKNNSPHHFTQDSRSCIAVNVNSEISQQNVINLRASSPDQQAFIDKILKMIFEGNNIIHIQVEENTNNRQAVSSPASVSQPLEENVITGCKSAVYGDSQKSSSGNPSGRLMQSFSIKQQ